MSRICSCQSMNCPEIGSEPPLRVSIPDGLPGAGAHVFVDRCILPAVELLWAIGVETTSNCCGHNGLFPRHVMVAKAEDGPKARAILDGAGWPCLEVCFWQRVTLAGAAVEGKG